MALNIKSSKKSSKQLSKLSNSHVTRHVKSWLAVLLTTSCLCVAPSLLSSARPPADPTASTEETSKVDWVPYIAAMEKKIRKNWQPPDRRESLIAIVKMRIDTNGNITQIGFKKPSGDAEFDEAAIEALKKTSPLPSLPPEYDKPSVNVFFQFDYSVTSKSKKTNPKNPKDESPLDRIIRVNGEALQRLLKSIPGTP